VKAESSGAIALDSIVKEGVRRNADIDTLAVKSDHGASVLIWNYHDEDVQVEPADIALSVNGIPQSSKRILARHYRVDRDHSNAYTAWQQMGSPQNPTPGQYAKLESAGQLQLLDSPKWMNADAGKLNLQFTLPRQGVSLVQLSW
jgi:xylan 1,4-beta-xylosidase